MMNKTIVIKKRINYEDEDIEIDLNKNKICVCVDTQKDEYYPQRWSVSIILYEKDKPFIFDIMNNKQRILLVKNIHMSNAFDYSQRIQNSILFEFKEIKSYYEVQTDESIKLDVEANIKPNKKGIYLCLCLIIFFLLIGMFKLLS